MSNAGDEDLFTLLGKFEQQHKLPPVDTWTPSIVGQIDIVINQKGEWFHQGGYFERQDLARMFASILRKDGDDYFLVTPAEKLKIEVEDVPFLIVLMKENNGVLSFITSLGDEVVLSRDCPMEFRISPLAKAGAEDFIPYVLIRKNLWAKVNQNTYYELMNLAQETTEGFEIVSGDYKVKIPA